MTKQRLWIGVAFMLALALLAWALWPRPIEVEVDVVTRGRFERDVREDGKTRLRERYVVSTPLAGRVARITLQQGDAVERDAVLATLWPAMSNLLDERARQEQRERIGAMEATVARTSAGVERARAALEQAIADLKRSETLAQQGFVSSTQNETGRLSVRLREKELESARQEEHAARHQLDQARIAIRQFVSGSADGAQRNWSIRSPIAGRVMRVLHQSEDTVPAGTPLLELGDPSRLEVVVDLLTEVAAQIRPGMSAALSNWGGTDTLAATVRVVEPAAFTKVSALGVDEQRVNVVLDITSPTDKWQTLGDAYKVDVRLLVQAMEQALQVPVSAIFPVGTRSALFVIDSGRAHQREVEVLARNGSHAWIKSDLQPGTEVVIYPPNALKEGERVIRITGR